MEIAVMALMIPIIGVCIPIVAILVNPYRENLKKRERDAARKTYERIVMEKLDVMKTAIAMGQSGDDLEELDARLERLVGSDKLKGLLSPETPKTPSMGESLLDADLLEEVERKKRKKSKAKH